MTYEELHAIATKKGTVRWNKSGIIEHLHVSKNGRLIFARPIKQSVKHIIKPPPKGLAPEKAWTFNCIELDPITKEPIGAAPVA